jgi:hypothetical protein
MQARRRPDPPVPCRPPSVEEEAAAARAWEAWKRGEITFFQVSRTKSGRMVLTTASVLHAEMYRPGAEAPGAGEGEPRRERPDCRE